MTTALRWRAWEARLRACSAHCPCGERVRHASSDVFHKDRPGTRRVARQRAFEQRLMLPCRFLAAIIQRDHLVTEIFVEHRGMRLEQHLRAAVRDKLLVA